uniref:Uncharacterized protein n=1 Tax=Daucus carota subsp. sativus TaxID=79200 RepID=A0A166CR03_DAUCS
MAAHFPTCNLVKEDYIDMAVSSQRSKFCHAMNSSLHPREFEFQMFPSLSERDRTTSPADELIYKGKLLPLHLPPRLQIVEKLLQNSNTYNKYADSFDECFSIPTENTAPLQAPTPLNPVIFHPLNLARPGSAGHNMNTIIS